jgi:outer membrane protein OmpA-like peptidoglycan-associated protein
MVLRRLRPLTAAVALAFLSAPAVATDTEAIVRALTPKPKPPVTRSFRPSEPTRGISIEGGDQPAAEPAPSIDLYVHFEYDQAALTMTDALLTLDALGRALKDPRLQSMRFAIVGHTDARGNDDYNLQLSRRRAEAVRSYLNQYHQIELGRLVAEGRGRRELKDPQRPEDGINRRVQIKTLDDRAS